MALTLLVTESEQGYKPIVEEIFQAMDTENTNIHRTRDKTLHEEDSKSARVHPREASSPSSGTNSARLALIDSAAKDLFIEWESLLN